MNKYKYILSGINVYSRYKVVRPLRMKQVQDVANMIADIYKTGTLTHPNKTKRSYTELDFKKQVIAFYNRVMTIQKGSSTPSKMRKINSGPDEGPDGMLLERNGKLTMWKSKSSCLQYSLFKSLPLWSMMNTRSR